MRDRREELVLASVRELCLDTRLLLASQDPLVRFLDALPLVDVGADRDPARDLAAFVGLGNDAQQMPTVFAVPAAQALLTFERFEIFNRNGAEQPVRGVIARVRMPDAICVCDGAILAHHPYASRDRLGHCPEADLVTALQLAPFLGAQQRFLPLDQLAPLPQVDEDRNLRSKDVRGERFDEVVDSAVGISFEDAGGIRRDRREKDDGHRSRPIPPSDHRSGGDPVHSRHIHVHQDDGEIALEEAAQGILPACGADQLFAQGRKNRLQCKEIGGPVVDHQ